MSEKYMKHLNKALSEIEKDGRLVQEPASMGIFAFTHKMLTASIDVEMSGLTIRQLDYRLIRASLKAAYLLTEVAGSISLKSKDIQSSLYIGLMYLDVKQSDSELAKVLNVKNANIDPILLELPFATPLDQLKATATLSTHLFVKAALDIGTRKTSHEVMEKVTESNLFGDVITRSMMGLIEENHDKETCDTLREVILAEVQRTLTLSMEAQNVEVA